MNWKIAQSIYNKIISNCPQGTYQQQLTKTPITNYPLSSRYGCFFCDGNSAHDYNVSTNYKTACAGKPSGHTRFLNFSSETERYNAWQSYLTKFARFCVMLDESTKACTLYGRLYRILDRRTIQTVFWADRHRMATDRYCH